MSWLERFWNFVDDRDIDKHLVCLFVLYGTVLETQWAQAFAVANVARPGLEIAAVIAAVTAPYMALQAAVIKFYFHSRTDSRTDQ